MMGLFSCFGSLASTQIGLWTADKKNVVSVSEGSEDELEVSSQDIKSEETKNPMEPIMVPPQNDGGLEMLPLKTPQYHNNNHSLRLTIKPYDQLYSKEEQNNLVNEITMKYLRQMSSDVEQATNGVKIDVAFTRAKEMVLTCGVLPQELEIKENGVFAKRSIEKSTKYGPFQGKWAGQPQDQRFAWEVSVSLLTKRNFTPQLPPLVPITLISPKILPILTLANVSEPFSSVAPIFVYSFVTL